MARVSADHVEDQRPWLGLFADLVCRNQCRFRRRGRRVVARVDLGKRIADAGLTVEGAIAFNSFLDDDDARRAASLEKLKIDMDKVAQIGGKRIAAPPGNNRNVTVTLDNAAKYYREALEMGQKAGVLPLLELWGTHPLLGPLSHGIYVTVAADGSQSVTIALGGHPAPVLRRADGAVREIGEPGSLLGIFEPVLTDTTVPIAPGDTLVLYTDGLTDAPSNQAVPIEELIELLEAEGDEPVELLADSIRPLKRRRRPRGRAPRRRQ